MNSDFNLVSVLMTAYNRGHYIAESIESVLVQTYKNFELIVVDDCSIDSTVKIAHSYAAKDDRIKIYVNEKNLGDYPNRNRAYSHATGSFIVFLDSDDTFNPDALKYIVDSFLMYPEVQHSTLYYGGLDSPTLMKSEEAVKKHFFIENILSCGPSARVFKRNFYSAMGGYPEKYGPAGDLYFNIKTTSNSSILLLPNLYLNYRIHSGQEKNNVFSYIHNGYNYFNDVLLLPELPITKSEKKYLFKKNKRRFVVNCLKYLFKTKNFKRTSSLLKSAHFTFFDFMQGILGAFNFVFILIRLSQYFLNQLS